MAYLNDYRTKRVIVDKERAPLVGQAFEQYATDVEVTPILYEGDKDWRGYLWDRTTHEKILTSIPLHLDFIRDRKEKQPTHFAQVIRLIKWCR